MERVLMYIRIFPGTEAEYDKRHAEIWPELVAEIQESGIHNFTGFRRGTDVWYYGECHPDVATAFGVHGPKPTNQRWNRYFRDVIAEIADDSGNMLGYTEVFHSDGPKLDGPFTRGSFSLVIDIERADDYERIHANACPHVVYYGEFYPDMATCFAKMGQTEVNGRWGKAFEGIITTITEPDGGLIVAKEMYHND